MSETRQDAGFRFGTIMAWAPALILTFAIIMFAMREVIGGFAMVVLALLVWLLLKRRRRMADSSPANPASPADPGSPVD